MARLFVALLPPPLVRSEVAGLTTPLPAMRWISAEQIHLTLRFVGSADLPRLDAYVTALARVTVEPFILPVEGTGVFPQRGPARVLWVGTGAGHTRLHQLRKQVDDALLSVDSTLEVDRFHPHLTVARIGDGYDPKRLAKFLERQRTFEAPPFRVNEFYLMASEATSTGGHAYRVVETFPLRGRE